MHHLQPDLALATNFFGPLPPEIKARIMRFVEAPSEEHWDAIYSLVVNGDANITLWRAVCEVDPTFPRILRKKTGFRGHSTLGGWARIPSVETICQAFAYATH